MGTKYIIEVEDKPFELLSEDGFTSEKLFRVKGFNSLVFDWNGLNKLTPYTEPDLEQVGKEAYQKGYETGYEDGYNEPGKNQEEVYQRGLADAKSGYDNGFENGMIVAWEAARKICGSVTAGGLNYNTLNAIFGSRYPEHIIDTFTASEAIERLKPYEQKQKEAEEQLQKEKEKSISVEDVMRQYLDMFCRNTKGCAECPLNTSDFTCGRGYHFMTDEGLVSDEEVRKAYATVLEEMRGENND